LFTHVSKCEDLPLVNPGNPDGSALVKVLEGECAKVPQMPLDCIPGEFGTCVPEEYSQAITQ